MELLKTLKLTKTIRIIQNQRRKRKMKRTGSKENIRKKKKNV
jgi:hypothetical protein